MTPAEQYAAYIDSLDWPSYDNHVDMVEAAQIPEYILSQMSTEDLVEAIMDYPLIVDLLAFDTYKEGFENIAEDFNGIQELLLRDDGADKLLEYYESIPVVTSTSSRSAISDKLILDPWFIEVILAQDEIISQFTQDEEETAVEIIESKYRQKQQASEIYSATATGFFEAMMENSGISTYNYAATIYTPKGTPVPVTVVTNYYTATEAKQTNDRIDAAYPNAVRIETCSYQYNCHSYAWYQSSPNKYWLDSANYSKFITDGSYTYTSNARVGGPAKYKSDDHSVIVTAVSGRDASWVKSKWGRYGAYVHTPAYCPYNAGQDDVGDKSLKIDYYYR